MKKVLLPLLVLVVFVIPALAQDLQEEIPNPLDVAFKCQGPPGEFGKSKNCGQTCVLMAMSYYNWTTPTVEGIMAIDDWLHVKYKDPINNYNGSGTNPTKILAVAREYGGFTLSYKASAWTIDDVKDRIDEGLPVIVSVYCRYLTTRIYKYAWEHFVLAIGYDENNIICHDPARAELAGVAYSNRDFAKAMAKQNGEVVVVVPDEEEEEQSAPVVESSSGGRTSWVGYPHPDDLPVIRLNPWWMAWR